MEATIGLLVLLAIGGVFYFLPTMIASSRGHHNTGAVAVINVFLGWTFIGWVIALAMSAGEVRRGIRDPRNWPPQPRFDPTTGERLR